MCIVAEAQYKQTISDLCDVIKQRRDQLSECDKLLEQREATILEQRSRVKGLETENDRLMNFDAVRLRRIATKLGVSVPESNETLLCCVGTVLGSMCRAIDDLYAGREAALKAERINTLKDAAWHFADTPKGREVKEELTRMANELKEQS